MKKIIISILSVAIILGGFLNGSLQVKAKSSSLDLVEVAVVYSKNIEATYYFRDFSDVPSTIYYNNNGWSGTLHFKEGYYKNKSYEIIYSGTVSCSGTCKMAQGEVQ